MAHDTGSMIAHGLHVAHHTEVGKKAIEAVGTGTIAVATAVLGPAVVAAAAPVAVVALLGWGVWSMFKD